MADYENGVSQQIQENTTTTAGQTIHTLSTVSKTSCDTEKPPNSKRSRIQYPDITSDSSGYVCFMYILLYLCSKCVYGISQATYVDILVISIPQHTEGSQLHDNVIYCDNALPHLLPNIVIHLLLIHVRICNTYTL